MTAGCLVSYTCNSEQRACCALVETWIAGTFVNHAAPAEMLPGPESLKGHMVLLRTAFPDLHFRVEELIADKECVAACVTLSGTQREVFWGFPPDKSCAQAQMHLVRFVKGEGRRTLGGEGRPECDATTWSASFVRAGSFVVTACCKRRGPPARRHAMKREAAVNVL